MLLKLTIRILIMTVVLAVAYIAATKAAGVRLRMRLNDDYEALAAAGTPPAPDAAAYVEAQYREQMPAKRLRLALGIFGVPFTIAGLLIWLAEFT